MLLLLFGVLVAVVLRGAAEAIAERTKLSPQVTLAVLAIVALVGFGALCYWIGPRLLQQMQDLVSRLTQQIEALREHIASTRWGHALSQELSPSALSGGGLLGTAGTAVTLTFRSLADMVPGGNRALPGGGAGLFSRGRCVRRPPSRGRMREVAHEVAHTWQLWVLGQSIDMLTVGDGRRWLWAAGVPAPFALAVVAALFTFNPYFGAIVAAIPAVLVALTVGWSTALVALGVYVACHLVEGHAVQRRWRRQGGRAAAGAEHRGDGLLGTLRTARAVPGAPIAVRPALSSCASLTWWTCWTISPGACSIPASVEEARARMLLPAATVRLSRRFCLG